MKKIKRLAPAQAGVRSPREATHDALKKGGKPAAAVRYAFGQGAAAGLKYPKQTMSAFQRARMRRMTP